MLYYATELSMPYLDSTIPYYSVLFHAITHVILDQVSPYNTIRHGVILNHTSQYLQKVYEGRSLHDFQAVVSRNSRENNGCNQKWRGPEQAF